MTRHTTTLVLHSTTGETHQPLNLGQSHLPKLIKTSAAWPKKYHTPPISPIHSPHLMEERFLLCNLVSSLNNSLTDCWRRKAMIRKWYCLVPASVGFPERDGKYWIILRFLLADAHREKNRCGTESLHLCDIYFQRGIASIVWGKRINCWQQL